MATEITSRAQGTQRPGNAGYEPRDASVPWIFGIVLFLICCGIVIHFALAGFLRHLLRGPATTDPWGSMSRPAQPVHSGAFPKLQISAPLDLQRFRADEEYKLTHYGWINKTSGIVQIPIERAMELVLQKGLPTVTNSASAAGPSPQQLMERRAEQWRNGEKQQP